MNKIASFGAAIPGGVIPGTRIPAPATDEDALTLVVEAAGRALAGVLGRAPAEVLVVSLTPPFLEGDTESIVVRSLGLPRTCRVRQVVGGGASLLETMHGAADAPHPVLVIGVHVASSRGDGAAACAVLMAPEGRIALGRLASSSRRAVPVRVRRTGDRSAFAYDDPRLMRDLAGRPVVGEVLGQLAPAEPVIFVGVPSGAAGKEGTGVTAELGYLGAAGPLLELYALETRQPGTSAAVVAGDGTFAAGLEATVEVSGPGLRLPEDPVDRHPMVPSDDFVMPASVASYARAFDAKVGFIGAQCSSCGIVNFPPRPHCLSCRTKGPFEPVDLPRKGRVYTATTVDVPVPGLPSRYGIAVVEVQPEVRVLVRMTQDDLDIRIDDEVELVLRRLADREGIPDYAYAARRVVDDEPRSG